MSKILIVDDSAIIREIVVEWLQKAGHAAIAIDSPVTFARAVATERPDLVLMDVDMPGVKGTKLASLNLARCPIVLHSSRSAEELTTACTECGATGFIEKTKDPRAFLLRLEAFLHA